MRKAAFGVIGLGHIAQAQHLPNLKRAPHCSLRAVCDLRPDVLESTRAKYQVPVATSDYKQLLNDPEIDAVCIATQEDMQASLTIEALKAGKHVYVEKPLARTVEECKAVAEAEAASDRFVVVGLNRRHAPAYMMARKIIQQKGGPRLIHYRLSDNACLGSGEKERIRVIREMCHIFDIARYFADSEVETMYCAETRPDEEVYVLKFKSGCVANIIGSGYVTRDVPKEHLEIVTNDPGAVIVEEFVELRTYGYREFDHIFRFAGHSHPDREFTHKYLFKVDGAHALHSVRRMAWELIDRSSQSKPEDEFADKEEMARYLPLYGTNPRWNYMVDKGWLGLVDHFGECILTGQRPTDAATAMDGLQSSILSHAAIRSRDTGQVVRL